MSAEQGEGRSLFFAVQKERPQLCCSAAKAASSSSDKPRKVFVWISCATNMGGGLPDASQLITRSSTLKMVTDSGCVMITGGFLTARTKTIVRELTIES